MKPRELRSYEGQEFRAVEENGIKRVNGYAVVFDSMSVPLWGFREIVKPGAFTKTLQEQKDVKSLWNHDSNKPLGRTSNGTLRLREDSTGLWYEVDLPATSWGQDAWESIRRGDVSQNSFQFTVVQDKWFKRETGDIRELIEVQLIEVSPVTFPAYEATDVQARNLLSRMGVDYDRLAEVAAQAERRGMMDDLCMMYGKSMSMIMDEVLRKSKQEEMPEEPPDNMPEMEPEMMSRNRLRHRLDILARLR